ncbi:FAD-binding oxidoreductase [bacterium]|nr:FAD-binding oxidoreductase [bacterium]
MSLRETIAPSIHGDVTDAPEELDRFSRDTSIFRRRPSLVAHPKNAEDLGLLVKKVHELRETGEAVSLTGRSGGTDMTGGPLTDSIVVSFTKYMNNLLEIGADYAVAEPGIYYRDFEKATMEKIGMLLPSYPASREICALGGIVSNNSGGELTLHYGKTERYVRELDVVLSDGSRATFGPLDAASLAAKKAQTDFEGLIYREMHALIEHNLPLIESKRPKVSKNSAGYALWSVYDKEKGTFDLSKVIVGSQGTLAMVTKAKIGLARRKQHRAMLVVFLKDLAVLPEIVHRVLKLDPESFESYDNHTFQLAVRFLPQILQNMGPLKALELGLSFFPELLMLLSGGVPKFVLMAEFSEDSEVAARDRVRDARLILADLPVKTRMAAGRIGPEKYWKIRRESFNLLRKNVPGLYAAPFIDDFVIDPDVYPQFLPELDALLSAHPFTFTIAGHVGNGNFHIFPLVDMTKESVHDEILELNGKVYDLVLKYGGSTTGEHNDGIIRTPYLKQMFGPEMYALFGETKRIFDPLNIFNPGKKVGGTKEDIARFMMRSSK